VQFSESRENCRKYGDPSLKFCNSVCLGKIVVNIGIGHYSFAMEFA
jgi:hypothetical protein